MKFSEVVMQTLTWLQRDGRVSYRALKREFDLDDEYIEDLKAEIIKAKRLAMDEDGEVLVWTGERAEGETAKRGNGKDSPESRVQSLESEQVQGPRSKVQSQEVQTLDPRRQTLDAAAERRQLTVLFCDLVGSTALSSQLDPEDYRAVVQRYQQTCTEVIQQHEGYLAQYLGDGLLVYFGYPTAHEDDARRAARTGLEIITALQKQVPSPLVGKGQGEGEAIADCRMPIVEDKSQSYSPPIPHSAFAIPQSHTPHPNLLPQGEKELRRLQVRIGIHTGLVVVGEIGSSEKRELLALGETPNLAARIQGLAEPNTVLISAATQRLIAGHFESQPLGTHLVKGIDTPIAVYHAQSERQNASPLAGKATLTPLVGREQEVGLLFDRWEQVKEGRGQVVLLSGEPGIGKSRLSYTLREHVTSEGSLLFEAHCSPYHQHSALYPLIEVFQRTLLLTRQDTDDEKVEKLERALALSNMQETLPLFTALFSLLTPVQYPPLNLTPQKQKERMLQALVQLLVAQAERQAIVFVWEDLHWADPSSLEFLTMLIEQIPTTKLLLVLTFRPEFTPPWKLRSHVSQFMLNRLGKKQVEAMIEKVSGPEAMSAEVLQQIVAKTDGVPLFVEELTKTVLESMESIESQSSRAFQAIPIPATLQEALLARLDRLSTARKTAQLGATLGREFSYELLHAVASIGETDLQTALAKLVEAEILYQRGVGEQARYFFKHALIQDTAYQSLLKSTRQQYHKQIAHVLEERFPETKESQPELLAHHYTEAGLVEQAIPYRQQAGQRAVQSSANKEAISHLTKGLDLLKLLPNTPERGWQELNLQITLGPVLFATRGWASPDTERTYTRARELCEQIGETPHLFPILYGLCQVYTTRAEYQVAHGLGEQLFTLAQRQQDPALFLVAHFGLGNILYYLGEFAQAREHLEQEHALYNSQKHRFLARLYGQDLEVTCQMFATFALCMLGYPNQAFQTSYEVVTLAQELTHPFSLAIALATTVTVHQLRREEKAAQKQADALIALCTEQGIPFFIAWGTIFRGWALAAHGRGEEEGIVQIRQGLAAFRATAAENWQTYFLALLAEACGQGGQSEEGLRVLAEALAIVDKTGERFYEAELYRLAGELLLRRSEGENGRQGEGETFPHSPDRPFSPSSPEECFQKAIEIARKQQAKSWELRASTSLARLWQQQGKATEAHNLLSDVYNWFTEGFDTKDLQEAKTLLESLSS